MYLKEIGKYVDIVQVGDDLGMTNGLIFSRDMYLKYYKYREKAIIDAIKKVSDAPVYFHSCGSIREIIPDLIEIGVEILNAVQIQARNMSSVELKKEFGNDLTFWGGGCDTQQILPNGSPEEVYAHVKQQLEVLSPGGGFVFQQVHNILPDVQAENILAMFSSVKDFKNN